MLALYLHGQFILKQKKERFMRVVLNVAAMVLASSLGFGSLAYAADDDFGARFSDAAPNAFGDPAEGGVNYDAFAMDESTAEMLNDMMPASGDEEEAEADSESEADAEHDEDAHGEEHDDETHDDIEEHDSEDDAEEEEEGDE